MTEYHEDSRCGACDGPLEVHRDAICETCHPTSQYFEEVGAMAEVIKDFAQEDKLPNTFEEAFAEQYWKRFPAMQKEMTEVLIEILEQMASVARMTAWRRRLRFRRNR